MQILHVVKFQILTKTWSVIVLNEDNFTARFGDQEAVTIAYCRTIYVNDEDSISRETLRHELAHAWYASMPLKAARLNAGQVEEVMAEMFGMYGPEIMKQAAYLCSKLKD